jgi:Small-conductance mechanosensitive channel
MNRIMAEFEKLADEFSPWLFTHGLKILLFLVLGYFLNKLSKRIVFKSIQSATLSEHSISADAEEKRKRTLIRILNGSITIIIVIVIAMMILQEFNIQIGPILASLGVVGLAVGFGGQYFIRDVIAGLFIIIEN